MPRLAFAIVLALFATLTPATTRARDQERLIRFHADVTVTRSGELRVVETIEIRARGDVFRRGLMREFPMRHDTGGLLPQRVSFVLESVRLNGQSEAHSLERRENGVAVYIGEESRALPQGRHTYEITYRTDRQLRFFDGRDELYWNVTGNGWDLRIDEASAAVHLPPGATPLRTAGWTGVRGSREQAVAVTGAGPLVEARATRALAPGEGLTIAVTWPAGHIDRRSGSRGISTILREERSTVVWALGLLVMGAHALLSYLLARRADPAVTAPLAEVPPGGLSPAALCLVHQRRFTDRCLVAGLLALEAKGVLSFQHDQGKLVLERAPGPAHPPLAPEEEAMHHVLFADGPRVPWGGGVLQMVSAARRELQAFTRTIADTHIDHDTRHGARAILLLLLFFLAAALSSERPGPAMGLAVLSLVFIPLGGYVGACLVRGIVRAVTRKRGANLGETAVIAFFALFSVPLALMIASFTAHRETPAAAFLLCSCFVVTTFAHRLRRRYTARGRAISALLRPFRRKLERGTTSLAPELASAYAFALGTGDGAETLDRQQDRLELETSRHRQDDADHSRHLRRSRGRVWSARAATTAVLGEDLLATVDAATREPRSSAFSDAASSSGSSGSSSSSSSGSGSSGGGGGGGGGGGW